MSMSPMNYEALRAASPTPSINLEADLQKQRGRRKRVAIELPADVALGNMDPKEVKKIKNRIAAARLRERSQQQIRELEAMVQFYKSRAEYLEGVVASCIVVLPLPDIPSSAQSLASDTNSKMSSCSQMSSIKVEPGQQQQQQQRGRRKRVAIEIPADIDLENMDPKEVKKIKNRIAAARLRERSQQQIRELEATIQYYKSRAEYLEGVTARCSHCSNLTQMQMRGPQHHVVRAQQVGAIKDEC
uniref:BZIP domain-containing protein n=1 Tax=Globisporangium ultimum (strain ATCC 200006 / CBS 805.95 / DAOM BR144) TaxID=431595 RepID=K3X9D3_GLOUD